MNQSKSGMPLEKLIVKQRLE